VTPWFAAGAGIVIAAALAVDSPTALTYAPNEPVTHCPASGCVGPTPSRQPDVATATPGVRLKTGGAAPAGRGRSHPARAVQRLGYQIVGRWRSGFLAVITVPGDTEPGSWRLQFAFPSARVDQVWGAQWRSSGDGDAGTATGPWRKGDRPADTGAPGGRQIDDHQVMVFATGTPTVPSGCRLDGVSCSFGR